MTQTRKHRLQVAVFLIWAALVLIGSWIKFPEIKGIEKIATHFTTHFGMYFILAILGVNPFGWWAILPCFVVGAGAETVQHFLPWRSGEFIHFVFSMIGVAGGLVVWRIALLIRGGKEPVLSPSSPRPSSTKDETTKDEMTS